MPAKDSELLTLAGFPRGINNTAKEESAPAGTLREAENIDLDAAGKPSRRDGYTLVQAGTQMHSAWSDDYFPFGLEVDAGTLYAVHADESRDALVNGLAPGLPLSYARIHDAVWWCNGVQSGQVTLELETRAWAAPQPPSPPRLAAAEGGLEPGRYQVILTGVDAWGRESGASSAALITLDSVGGIALAAIPQTGARTRVYVTEPNGSVFRAAYLLDAGVTDVVVSAPAQGRRCDTFALAPMPPGQLVAYGNGRQFVARGKEVLFSPALRYGLIDPVGGRVGFVKRVDMLAFVGDGTDGAGLFVSDGKRTYFLAGPDPAQWRPVIAYGAGAIPGQLGWAPGKVWGLDSEVPLPVWQARDGRLCVGLPGGSVFCPQSGDGQPDAVFETGERAALLFRETAGDRRVISALRGAAPLAFAVRDQLIVTEYPHE